MDNFWLKLPKPFFVLAPMHDVTESTFRQVVVRCGRPDVLFTEFTPVAGLCSAGREHVLHYLKFASAEKPLVAQFFGSDPEQFRESAKLAAGLGFAGIDINLGCAVSSIQKQGAGSALIKNPALAIEIIRASKDGAGDLPVSVKTRIGYSKNEIGTWLPALLSAEPSVITLHARTAKQGYGGLADWSVVKEAVVIAKDSGVLIVGNGDVKNFAEAHSRVVETGCDGVMIGRAVLKNPWVFNTEKNIATAAERFAILKYHFDLFRETYPQSENLSFFKKYIAGYISGFPEAKELRIGLMEARNPAELAEKLRGFADSRKV